MVVTQKNHGDVPPAGGAVMPISVSRPPPPAQMSGRMPTKQAVDAARRNQTRARHAEVAGHIAQVASFDREGCGVVPRALVAQRQ
jgi:hypothetical protein